MDRYEELNRSIKKRARKINKSSRKVQDSVRKFRKGKRRKGIVWEYNYDGDFARERYNSDDKRYWRRWKRRQAKKDLTSD